MASIKALASVQLRYDIEVSFGEREECPNEDFQHNARGGVVACPDDDRGRQHIHGFWFYNSPDVTLTQNTCVANLYSAAAFLYSCENSICKNNSFTYQGNDVIVIEENVGDKGSLATFDCDYNNYGTSLREQPQGTTFRPPDLGWALRWR